ncbi:two-component regulator propeller domain-containing protein [Desulforamulus ruminis]|nr:two-component regulator propeller domain-containing protein [Desulforamulus ruminis]
MEPSAHAASFGTLPGNKFSRITSSNGLIWITKNFGTTNYYWNGSAWIAGNSTISGTYPYNKTPNDAVYDIFIDNQGRLWFSGLYDSDDNRHTTGYFQMNSTGKVISNFGYEYFFKAKDGTVWTFGYPEGDYYRYPTVGYFTGEGFTHLPVYAPFNIHCFTVDHTGKPWIGSDNNEVAYWNGSSWVRCDPPIPGRCNIWTLATTSDGSIIAVASDDYASGWAIYKSGTWTLMESASDSSSARPISSLKVENGPDGKIWGVTTAGGLSYYEDGIWKKTIPSPIGIADFTVDSTGIVWVVSDTKVAAYIEGAWYTDTDSFSAKLIEAAKKAADKAALEAQEANESATSGKNILENGYNNNGKSLSATYDKANNAQNNSWYTGTYGGTAESVGNVAGYIRIPQYHGS